MRLFFGRTLLGGLLVVFGLVGAARAAGPAYWDWPSDRSFAGLDLAGTAIDGDGYLRAGLSAEQVAGLTGPEMFWRAVADGRGGFYAGSGHGGQLYHVDAAGTPALLAEVTASEILSLLLLGPDDLLVGCGATGEVYRIGPDGEARLVGTVPGGYVWSLTRSTVDRRVWLGVGSPGAVYAYDPETDELAEHLALPVDNVTAVSAADDGSVLAATQGPGLVYRLQGDASFTLVAELPQDEVRSLIRGPQGEVYALAVQAANGPASAPRAAGGKSPATNEAELMVMLGGEETPTVAPSALYQLRRGGSAAEIWSGKKPLLAAAWSPRWGWLGGGELAGNETRTTLWQLLPPSGEVPLARWSGGDVLDILVPGDPKGTVVVCQAHAGAVSVLTPRAAKSVTAFSQPLDGGLPVQWGRLRWDGAGDLGGVRWSVRGGNRAEPDESWTEWTKSWSGTDHALDLTASRYLQWRVSLPASAGEPNAARITMVSVSAWEDNLAPVIQGFKVEQLRDIRLGGLLNGSESVTQRFRSGLQAEFSLNKAGVEWAEPDRGALGRSVRVFSWQASDPNGDRLDFRLEYRKTGSETWRSVSGVRPGVFNISDNIASWDTAEVPDGLYEVRIVASDGRDNPAGLAAETLRGLGPLRVDNSPPEVADLQVRKTAAGVSVRFRAADEANVLAGARLRLPDGTFERLDPVDRICDSNEEEFFATIAWPRPDAPAVPEPWQIQLEVRDLGGNIVTATGEAR